MVGSTTGSTGPATQGGEPEDLMAGIGGDEVIPGDLTAGNGAVTAFSLQLFQKALAEGDSTLISPVSILYALAMTANGAEGTTLAQLEDLFGMDIETLNSYCATWLAAQGKQMKLANSIWYAQDRDVSVNEEFSRKNKTYYRADLYSLPFNDDACEHINKWVEEHTDGMIPTVLDKINEDALMYLINALAFEDSWEVEYLDHSIRPRDFTDGDGKTYPVDMMYSEEDLYLEDENATGFIKYFAGRKYAFVALLPNEGLTVDDYVRGLTPQRLDTLLSQPQDFPVNAGLPRFETENMLQLNEVLNALGVTEAFTPGEADFKPMGESAEGPLYISSVMQKTFFQVDAKGAKAGAATVVTMAPGSAMPEQREEKTVVLDRPFVYMLMDCETNIPVFMGTMQAPAPAQ